MSQGKPLRKAVIGSARDMDEAGMVQAHAALRAILPRHGGADRDRLAPPVHRLLRELKVFGILGLRMVFSLAQMSLLNRHRIPD
jgi:hypothetical protein